MIILILLLIISLQTGCTTTEQPQVEIQKIADYSYLEKYNASTTFKVKTSLYIISELVSTVDSLNNRKSKLKEISFIQDSVDAKAELIFDNKKRKTIVDAIQANQVVEHSTELAGKRLDADQKGAFFHQEYLIPLREKHEIVARVYGIEEQSKVQFLFNQNTIKEFNIPDAPNYFVEIMDLNGDGLNEILVYSAPINRVDLKIFQAEFIVEE